MAIRETRVLSHCAQVSRILLLFLNLLLNICHLVTSLCVCKKKPNFWGSMYYFLMSTNISIIHSLSFWVHFFEYYNILFGLAAVSQPRGFSSKSIYLCTAHHIAALTLLLRDLKNVFLLSLEATLRPASPGFATWRWGGFGFFWWLFGNFLAHFDPWTICDNSLQ